MSTLNRNLVSRFQTQLVQLAAQIGELEAQRKRELAQKKPKAAIDTFAAIQAANAQSKRVAACLDHAQRVG